MNDFDVLIAGGGAAGLTAALYCALGGLKTAVIEKYPVCGGQMNLTDTVENFPAVPMAGGFEIGERLAHQAKEAGAQIIYREIREIVNGDVKTIAADRDVYTAPAVIYAMGAQHRKLGVPGEQRLAGKGVSYCAVCDGGFFRGKTVSVIGGGDTALKDALYLSRICQQVYLIHRRSSFRGNKRLLQSCEEAENIAIVRDSVCMEITGADKVDGLIASNKGENRRIDCSAVFAAVGTVPCSQLLQGICRLTSDGYVDAGEDCRTSAEGIFAAGDVRQKPYRQIITACADGANAALGVLADRN